MAMGVDRYPQRAREYGRLLVSPDPVDELEE